MDGFAPSDKNGNYKRPKGLDFDKNYKINLEINDSFYLLIGSTCPWCHRTLLFTALKKISKIKIIYLKPNLNNGEWIFENNFFGNKSLTQLYKRTYKKNFLRATVPVLIKKKGEKVELISNESGQILEILNEFITNKKENIIQFDKCDNVFLRQINDDINNGVYKCGFARNQRSYIDASDKLFKRLKEINSFIKESKGRPKLPSNAINLLPLYWKYIYANFYVDYSPKVPHYWQWDLNRGETKSWLSIKRSQLLSLSINQLALIYNLCNCCCMEENITYKDIADMWIHEGFTCYSENLYVDYFFGKEASAEYVIGTRRGISNRKPIIGQYDINREGSSDMYSKGANLLHTIRQLAKNDEIWRNTLRGLNKEFYHSTVTTREIEEYISKSIGMDLSKVFDQYLRDYRVPIFEYKINKGELYYRWSNVIDGFNMPVEVNIDGKSKFLYPSEKFKKHPIKNLFINVDDDYYVYSKDLKIIVDN